MTIDKLPLQIATIPDVSMSDDDIRRYVLVLDNGRRASGCGWYLTISGYDSDPRALYEIPECVSFIREWIRQGGLSVLVKHTPKVFKDRGISFDAFDLWCIREGHFPLGEHEVTKEIDDQFEFDLYESKRRIGQV